MTSRATHLVGSIPGNTAEEAMRLAMGHVGRHLHSLPDGETAERRNWIISIVESFRNHPDLELVKDGDWSSYEIIPQFRIRRGHQLRADSLDFGHVTSFEASYPIFQRLRAESGRSDLVFQVGVPGDFDMTFFTLGPIAAFSKKRRPFTEATIREIEEIYARAGTDVIFQIEVPVEMILLSKMPALAQPLMTKMMGRPIADLARRSPAGARFGVHLCLGDMNNKALGRMGASAVVRLANAVVARWPEGRSLEFLHIPLAAGDQPAPLDRSFYAPLSRLRLPDSTRLIVGMVHEGRSDEEERQTLAMIEEEVGRSVDVAASCGLGRRNRAAAETNMKRAAVLCEEQRLGTFPTP